MRAFTTKELNDYAIELHKFKSPWISRKVFGIWFLVGRYAILPIFVILFVGFLLYSFINMPTSKADMFFNIFKGIFFVLFGCVIIIFIARTLEKLKIRRTRKKMGLSLEEWNFLIEFFQIERTW